MLNPNQKPVSQHNRHLRTVALATAGVVGLTAIGFGFSSPGQLQQLLPFLAIDHPAPHSEAPAETHAAHKVALPGHPADKGDIEASVLAAESASANSSSVRLSVVHPQVGGLQRSISQTGSLVASESAKLSARVSGYMKVIHVDIGMPVSAGQVLAEIDVPDLLQDLRLTEAQVLKARSEVQQAEARSRVTASEQDTFRAMLEETEAEIAKFVSERQLREKEVERLLGLLKRGSISERIHDEKQIQLEQAQAAELHARKSASVVKTRIDGLAARLTLEKANIATAEAALKIAEANVERARLQVEFSKVVAPFSGVITSRKCDIGDFVRSAAQGGDQPLFTIADTSTMRVVVSIPDRMVPYIRPGDQAQVRVDALYGEFFNGQVTRVSMQQDRQTRSMRAEIDLTNTDGRLVDGMYGSVTIVTAPPTDGVTVPITSLLQDAKDGLAHLFVVRGGRIAEVIARMGMRSDGRIEIFGGLDLNDVIVSNPGPKLRVGLLADAVFADSTTDQLAVIGNEALSSGSSDAD